MARFIQHRHEHRHDGRLPLKYEYDVQVHSISDLPVSVSAVAVAMARGPKKYSTATIGVKSKNVEFSAQEGRIRLAANTVYRDALSGQFDDKVYTLRVTLTDGMHGSELLSRPPTLSVSAPIDLSKFISAPVVERVSVDVPFSSARNAPKLRCELTIRARPARPAQPVRGVAPVRVLFF
jgi:hypothetical protein